MIGVIQKKYKKKKKTDTMIIYFAFCVVSQLNAFKTYIHESLNSYRCTSMSVNVNVNEYEYLSLCKVMNAYELISNFDELCKC